ncbi:MAG: M48 family metallopeptidase [Leptotrichiaceae bacterium]|nr:M48 family metallopeptidase [Leptotrichiaceae bacterium]MBP7100802.1 M48 family metallopeptidase [Leptotrichiaceae bacterium]MBP7725482.1 M48 family metallopeptidase [Leptotrichiaceae bacterium]MBP9628867.1 M48 family metallopeptidase [Leptotrichiaceae bacterium]
MKKENILGYSVYRKKIKNINLRINQNMEVHISAPINLHKSYIESFIFSKEEWIKKSLKKMEELKIRNKEFEYITGEIHKLMGEEYTLIVEKSNSNSIRLDKHKKEILLYTNYETVENRKKIIYKWYLEYSKKIFYYYIEKWIKILNERIEHISIKSMKTRWGSCNYNKRYVNINIELIKRSRFEIEYVILHELAHLKHPNHSKKFYDYVEKYMPNYKIAEKMLKTKH